MQAGRGQLCVSAARSAGCGLKLCLTGMLWSTTAWRVFIWYYLTMCAAVQQEWTAIRVGGLFKVLDGRRRWTASGVATEK